MARVNIDVNINLHDRSSILYVLIRTLQTVSEYAVTTQINRPVTKLWKEEDGDEQYSKLHQSPINYMYMFVQGPCMHSLLYRQFRTK